LPIRPALKASRPASMARRIAVAMATGSLAEAIAVFIRTPSQPSSIAMAASDAVPTPASTSTGTVTASRISLMLYGLRMPSPDPIGAPSGMTAAAPASSSFLAMTGSSLVYGSTVNPSRESVRVASRRPITSGNRVRESPMTSSLTRVPRPASRAR
jgi:hypothetical protein